jgi:hypothetical protein
MGRPQRALWGDKGYVGIFLRSDDHTYIACKGTSLDGLMSTRSEGESGLFACLSLPRRLDKITLLPYAEIEIIL